MYYRLAALWAALALLLLPTGIVLAGGIGEAGMFGFPIALVSPVSVVLLVNIATNDHGDLGDYVLGENETLFLAGQEASARTDH